MQQLDGKREDIIETACNLPCDDPRPLDDIRRVYYGVVSTRILSGCLSRDWKVVSLLGEMNQFEIQVLDREAESLVNGIIRGLRPARRLAVPPRM